MVTVAGEAVGVDGGGGAAPAAVEAAVRAGAARRGEQAGRRRRSRRRGGGTQKNVQSNGKSPFSEAGRLETNIDTRIEVDWDLQTLDETL